MTSACFNCRVPFDTPTPTGCSCLTNERTLVCTNCLTCFCKSSPSYKEKFWLEAPPHLFERKFVELRKQQDRAAANVAPEQSEAAARPSRRRRRRNSDDRFQPVCANLGYGFVSANNGQDGLDLARLYRPDLILLSDALKPTARRPRDVPHPQRGIGDSRLQDGRDDRPLHRYEV